MTTTLYGFRFSVYTWVVRWALFETGIAYETVERNPFVPPGCTEHPFNRVPVFQHEGRSIFETRAITTYIANAFGKPSCAVDDPTKMAQYEQIISIADHYVYPILVRQVFENGYFLPAIGHPADYTALQHGLDDAQHILAELNALIMANNPISRADIHLAPMIGYFSRVETGQKMLSEYRNLAEWFSVVSKCPGYITTQPKLPGD